MISLHRVQEVVAILTNSKLERRNSDFGGKINGRNTTEAKVAGAAGALVLNARRKNTTEMSGPSTPLLGHSSREPHSASAFM